MGTFPWHQIWPPEMVTFVGRETAPRSQSLFEISVFKQSFYFWNTGLGRMRCISSPKFISSNISRFFRNPFSFSGHVWSCLILQSTTWKSCQRSPSDESRDLFATLLPDFSWDPHRRVPACFAMPLRLLLCVFSQQVEWCSIMYIIYHVYIYIHNVYTLYCYIYLCCPTATSYEITCFAKESC